jgi:hypothetical protein
MADSPRSVTGLVFVVYLWYLIHELWFSEGQFDPSRASGPSPFNALFGLLITGFPCLTRSLIGKFSLDPNN